MELSLCTWERGRTRMRGIRYQGRDSAAAGEQLAVILRGPGGLRARGAPWWSITTRREGQERKSGDVWMIHSCFPACPPARSPPLVVGALRLPRAPERTAQPLYARCPAERELSRWIKTRTANRRKRKKQTALRRRSSRIGVICAENKSCVCHGALWSAVNALSFIYFSLSSPWMKWDAVPRPAYEPFCCRSSKRCIRFHVNRAAYGATSGFPQQGSYSTDAQECSDPSLIGATEPIWLDFIY